MNLSGKNWSTLYRSYSDEIIEHIIHDYEHRRNQQLPNYCSPYHVNRKRYKDEFWKEIIKEHFLHGYCPLDTISFSRTITGGRTPWPDTLRRLPKILSCDPSLEGRFRTVESNPFDLGYLSNCYTPQKLEKTIEHWRKTNPSALTDYKGSRFTMMLIDPIAQLTLMDAPAARHLTAEVLINTCDLKIRTDTEKVLGKWLVELADRLTSRD